MNPAAQKNSQSPFLLQSNSLVQQSPLQLQTTDFSPNQVLPIKIEIPDETIIHDQIPSQYSRQLISSTTALPLETLINSSTTEIMTRIEINNNQGNAIHNLNITQNSSLQIIDPGSSPSHMFHNQSSTQIDSPPQFESFSSSLRTRFWNFSRSQENASTTPQNSNLVSETEVKLYLQRTIGFFIGMNLAAIAILCMIHHHAPFHWIFAAFYTYLIYFILESIFRACLRQRENWRVREDILNIFMAISGLIFIGTLHLKIQHWFPTSLVGFLAFLLMTVNYPFMSKAPIPTKRRRFFNNCFFTFQSLLISLKLEKIIHCDWEFALTPFWIYFFAIMCYYLFIMSRFFNIANPSSNSQNSAVNELDVRTQFLGLCWSFMYYGLNVIAYLTASGFVRVLKQKHRERTFYLLHKAAFTGLFFTGLLALYTICAFKSLVRYLQNSEIPRNVSIDLQVPRRVQHPQQVEIKVEEQEKFFVMRSWTYFLPIKNLFKNKERLKELKNLLKGFKFGKCHRNRGCCLKRTFNKQMDLQTLKQFQGRKFTPNEGIKANNLSATIMEQENDWDVTNLASPSPPTKKRRNRYFSLTDADHIKELNIDMEMKEDSKRDEEARLCYLCCEKPPNAILLNCGHGGICYECAVNLMKTKNRCMQCRCFVDEIYKVDPNPKLFDIVKGSESTKIIKSENKI